MGLVCKSTFISGEDKLIAAYEGAFFTYPSNPPKISKIFVKHLLFFPIDGANYLC